ncbi:hypothetical protein OFO27_06660 [Campylobacter sp. CS_ED1]|uniref:hypothetical protein n=2 Tax=Campylobacter TaxID=194 RepID=UPI0022E9BE9D|nr:hypothetical protein [Campylobacter sp. CS_ED1]MDA3086210.1 hypothetical protein [Campylobacter sp. CS_ED1]
MWLNLRKFFGFLALLLCFISFFYAVFMQLSGNFFAILYYPISAIFFLFSLYFYFKQDKKTKRQMVGFALIFVFIVLPFVSVKFYNYAFKEPSYLVGEIILAKKISNSDGNITKYLKPQVIQTIKSQNLDYLKSQGFSVNSQSERASAFFKGVIKRRNFAISIIIENDKVEVLAFSGYNAL